MGRTALLFYQTCRLQSALYLLRCQVYLPRTWTKKEPCRNPDLGGQLSRHDGGGHRRRTASAKKCLSAAKQPCCKKQNSTSGDKRIGESEKYSGSGLHYL